MYTQIVVIHKICEHFSALIHDFNHSTSNTKHMANHKLIYCLLFPLISRLIIDLFFRLILWNFSALTFQGFSWENNGMQWSPHNQGSLIKNMPPWLIPKNYKSKWSWLSSFYFFFFFRLNTGGIDFIFFCIFSRNSIFISKESIEQTKPEFTKVKKNKKQKRIQWKIDNVACIHDAVELSAKFPFLY